MQLLTTVEVYIWELARRAVAEDLGDGTISAIVPEAPGVVAFGPDHHACSLDLLRRLEDWVKVGLSKRWRFPIVGGIDLNSDQARLLASWHGGEPSPIRGEFYANEDELSAAFEKHSRST